MNEEMNEQEIRQLERELRSYGDPYASPEPDERYFANFRARVLERIAEQPEAVSVMQRVSEFFFGSTLRMALSGGTVIAGALLYFSLQGSPEAPIAQDAPVAAPQVVPTPEAVAPPVANTPTMKQEIAQPTQVVPTPTVREKSTPVTPKNTVSENAPPTENIVDASAEFENIDELSMSEETDPVSYDKYSMEELEAVLKTLEAEPLNIQ